MVTAFTKKRGVPKVSKSLGPAGNQKTTHTPGAMMLIEPIGMFDRVQECLLAKVVRGRSSWSTACFWKLWTAVKLWLEILTDMAACTCVRQQNIHTKHEEPHAQFDGPTQDSADSTHRIALDVLCDP